MQSEAPVLRELNFRRRRRFVAELLMALHDSALADSALREAALRVLCCVHAAPSYAADLSQQAGDFDWVGLLYVPILIVIHPSGCQQRTCMP